MTKDSRILSAVLVGGTAVSLLDGLDAVVAFRLALGLDPKTIYQFVASGMLGPSAFAGGTATALLGVAVHCLIAFSAAAAFAVASVRFPALVAHAAAAGVLYGVGVYFFMNHVVIALSRIPPSPFSLPLFLNGVIGHALFVGLPIAYSVRHYFAGGTNAVDRRLANA